VNLAIALVIATMFGVGATLLLKPDLLRVVIGLVLVSNAASLAVISSGLTRGGAVIEPLDAGEPVGDPLAQAMTLTAIVIGFAVTALLLAMAYRVYVTTRSVDLDELSRAEQDAEDATVRENAEQDEEFAHELGEEEAPTR
jgi:multicomponent Na+:H+ antiporter subunit C